MLAHLACVTDDVSTLDQRVLSIGMLTRWPNIEPTSDWCDVFAG